MTDASPAFCPDILRRIHTPQGERILTLLGDARYVGGGVRDALLERTPGDVDIATSVRPEACMARLGEAGVRVIPTGLAHGTVTALIDGVNLEITTLRHDVDCDGRHAEVVFTDDWEADAARRDFTMNALSLDIRGQLYDYCNGVADARAGRVRFIGDPAARIREDYLRILRFFRFHAWFGTGTPDAAGLKACAAEVEGLDGLSGERIRTEMLKLLESPAPARVLTAMEKAGVLTHILPEGYGLPPLRSLQSVEKEDNTTPDALRRLAAMHLTAETSAIAEELGKRWRLSGQERLALAALLEEAAALHPKIPETAQKARLRRAGAMIFRNAVLLARARDAGGDEAAAAAYRAMLTLADTWEIPVFPLRGADLLSRGVPAGPEVGRLLTALETAWEASDYQETREALLAQAERMTQVSS